MEQKSMKIVFDGQNNQIDANTLINVLLHYQTVIDRANYVYGSGSRDIKMKVNAIEKGSFIIDLCIVQTLMNVFNKDAVSYLSGLVTVIEGVFKAYKKLKGKPVDNDNDFVINDNRTYNNTIIKIYNERSVREAISKSIETANSDENVEGMWVGETKEKGVEFEKQNFKDYIYTDFDEEEMLPEERAEITEAMLTIIGLNFEPGSKWQFIYNGFKIGMVVKDDALMRRIDEGDRFGKGDAIKVRMRITQRYNPTYKAYENKSYKIVEFLEHINAPSQKKLF